MTGPCTWSSCDPSWFLECSVVFFLVGLIWFIDYFATTFLDTHYSLLAKTGFMRMRLTWKNNQKTIDTSRDANFAIIRNCRLGNGHDRHSLGGPGRGWNPFPDAPHTTVVHNVIISTRSTGPLHNSSQLLFMITPFKQLWSRVSYTRSCHRH